MSRSRLIILIVIAAAFAGFAVLMTPAAHYTCAGNDNVTLDLKFFRSGNFTIVGQHLDRIEDGVAMPFTYTGVYREGPHSYDLTFHGLSRKKIEKIFAATTAGGFIKESDLYRFNKKTADGMNRVLIENCLIEKR